ncbi:MAG: hypothetical protein AB7O88_24325 [Reyranellaceae bacterium]
MPSAQSFERQLRIATAGLEPKAVSALLAKTARDALAEAIARGEASSVYTRVVNGRVGAPEESVIVPGPIVYRFNYLDDAVVYALAFCEARSPVLSGLYRRSWFALVDGAPWKEGTAIPADAEVVVTNDQPYHRKVEVGAMRMSVPPRIVESARRALLSRFGRDLLRVEVRFIRLQGGYILRRARRGRGRAKGTPITYPALIINAA